MKNKKLVLIAFFMTLFSGCSFFDKDNTPPPARLCAYTPETHVRPIWKSNTGSKMSTDQLKHTAAIGNQTIFTTGKNGMVTATDRMTGRLLWKVKTSVSEISGAGINNNSVFVGSLTGDVLALRQDNGSLIWKTKVSSEVLAPPVASQGVVLVKAIDGKVSALSEQDGRELWHFDQTEPNFILRGSSAPQVSNNNVIVGFANGNLVKLSLKDGTLLWHQPLTIPQGSFAIQRLIDIDADPIINNNRIFAATYQGQLVSLDFYSGKTLWTHDMSSFSGIAADKQRVYVSDANSHVWAFDGTNGRVNWRQPELEARNTTAPVTMGNYIVVGDAQGYLHWLSKSDGHIVGRVFVNKSGIVATPVVQDNILYVTAKDGNLSAYSLG